MFWGWIKKKAFLASVKFKDPESATRCQGQMGKWRPDMKIWVFPLFASGVPQADFGVFF